MATKDMLARSATNYSRMIDHTLLKPDATSADIRKLCEEAIRFRFFSVCINPSFISLAGKLLASEDIKICTVIGFPLGAITPESKADEASRAVLLGANELDMVMAIGRLKEGDHKFVEEDILGVVQAAAGRPVKVIIETSLLNESEKRSACEAALAAGAQFVKTSTGFSGGGATVNDIRLMKSVVGEKMEVKASGGVRSLDEIVALVDAGATRIGTSQGPKIFSHAEAAPGEY